MLGFGFGFLGLRLRWRLAIDVRNVVAVSIGFVGRRGLCAGGGGGDGHFRFAEKYHVQELQFLGLSSRKGWLQSGWERAEFRLAEDMGQQG